MDGDNLREILRQCKKYYHNSQDWYDDSWEEGFSCNDLIENEIKKLEIQLEKMKCCGNCKHSQFGYVCAKPEYDCDGIDKWELK